MSPGPIVQFPEPRPKYIRQWLVCTRLAISSTLAPFETDKSGEE